MTWRGSTTPQDRIFACLPYLLPLAEVLRFGSSLFQQFPALGIPFIPLVPLAQIVQAPFIGLIIFIAIFMGVVRNDRIAHFIRFNAMQAILLSIVIFIGGILLSLLGKPLSSLPLLLETILNTVFIGIVVASIYGIVQSALGRYAEIPAVSEAAYMQVR